MECIGGMAAVVVDCLVDVPPTRTWWTLTAAHGANAAAAYAVGRRGPATAPDSAALAAFLAEDPLAERLFGASAR